MRAAAGAVLGRPGQGRRWTGPALDTTRAGQQSPAHRSSAPIRAPCKPRTEIPPLAEDAADHRYDADLLVVLTDAARLVRTLADRRARAHGMTRAQWLILFRLRSRPGVTDVSFELAPVDQDLSEMTGAAAALAGAPIAAAL